jgi:predicted GNAT family acetyltransferase
VHRLLFDRDTDLLLDFLLQDEAANTFLLGNLLFYGVEDDGRSYRCGDYWGYYEENRMVGVAAFFNNSQCMVYYTSDTVVPEMTEQINDNPVRLVLGCTRCVQPLVSRLRRRSGSMVVHRQYFMEFLSTEINRKAYAGMEFEDARRFRFSHAMQDFIMRCMKEGFGYSIRRSTVKRLLSEKKPEEHYLVLKVGKKYVAQAHIQTLSPRFAQIGGVCTLPEEQHKGYGYSVLCRMLDIIVSGSRRRPCLVVNCDNDNARQLYENLGFRRTMDLMLIDYI